MIHTEALKLALEALESTQLFAAHEHYPRRRVADALDALRAALEQPEQEPVAWVEKDGELVWCDKARATGRNLYIRPPRREWRGLTEEEFWPMLEAEGRADRKPVEIIAALARAIEAALKERNL